MQRINPCPVINRTVSASVGSALLLLVAASSCGPQTDGVSTAPNAKGGGAKPVAVATDENTRLKQRANLLWKVTLEEDWATAFQFEAWRGAEMGTVEDFERYGREENPFRYKKAVVGEVLTEDDMGWVELDADIAMRRFPGLPSNAVVRWDKWRRVDGEWYPVPPNELVAYPESPAIRDAVAESILREHVSVYWDARANADWDALYLMIDPEDRERVSSEEIEESFGLMVYVSHEISWVEVIEGKGSVFFVFVHTLNDPNLSKLPPRTVEVEEKWVRRGDEWYLDLIPE